MKKIIAREWLLIAAFFLLGLIVQIIGAQFYNLKDTEGFGIATIIYLFTQFVRSIVWAVRTLRKKKE